MIKSIEIFIKKLWKHEIQPHTAYYLLLTSILFLALFVRVYRVGDLLGFWYDQGRDALIIWKLWHEGKFFLIGPVTGLAGIFLGPMYYYLIAPLYLIGGGNPVYPVVFLALLSVFAIFMLFVTVYDMHSRGAGLIAVIIASCSYYIIIVNQWLSNPNPIFLTSVLFLLALWKIVRGKSKKVDSTWWVLALLMLGLSLQFESASAIFYLPVMVVFIIWQKKSLPSRTLLIALSLFFATLLPQIIFNFRHDNILFSNLQKLFFEEKAFRGISGFILEEKIKYFWTVISSKLYPKGSLLSLTFIILVFSSLVVRRGFLKKGLTGLFMIFLLTPVFFVTFFQGNFGHLYDYYMSGYYLPFVAIFSIGMAELWRTNIGKISVIIFFVTFLNANGILIKNRLTDQLQGQTDISFANQVKAVDWIFNNAAGKGNFNVDIYVPPVIPYAYDYLILWQGTKICGESMCGKVDYQTPLLYTLYESDPPNPERLETWLLRQEKIGVVQDEGKYGGITVQRRKRIQ
ncbi:hypothetical protein A3A76_03935 [Candidatus Woesebacteria bacterium RIFCSPLOWO2_01_FULL_39_23]|uniref:Glycosyltransferase RgtA/B/C/D-like domain-containing protein n=1 Tax=Candidatus Woesebacteria bacterium RIFCSPHIGHO2_01_FULL_40_22 TaxID=1802499 RepID=A0A1F7YJS5_9BACT|nr:MAG: hypothetical protein A2141_00070 [Candidatus Woesebacteria bacterium RBG_16_40_11]OGM27604.1 MAG: hypothetical protein A2628_02335 [Candidatus Woesebacteria bacterium RIFCSPHIGHO2_01_FULL_40_22]OGM62778.1 MAG: hypothetical protein A3A76_03935 [Candidatus Woesebacteria bacterium RIFCSPLOWO2_01_FULL_39_23]